MRRWLERSARYVAQAGTTDVVDATVVVLAHIMAVPAVTADAADLRALAGAAGWPITLHEI